MRRGKGYARHFKVPSAEELDHDYLWRYARRLPGRGEIAIFNRSHYEEVLVVRVRRVDLPDHNWKFSAADAKERTFWDDYQKAFSDMLSHTSTEYAPWYVVPADRKWFARVCTSAILAHSLVGLDPSYPPVTDQQRQELLEVKATLEAEAPKGAAPDPFQQEQTARTGDPAN